jgi:diguanylate cyclase (GGDEF)-like protein
LGSVVMARRIVRPINALASAAGLIESGDYSQPVPRLSDDEIGALATSVEHMRTQVAIREGKILRLAFEDALTGLPNRNRLIEKIEQSVQTSSGLVAVLNIDRFASINNALGFGVGDHLLTRIGDRLLEIQPVPLMLARLWGNEFAFLCEDMDRDEAVGFVDAVMQILREPVIVDGQRLDVGGTMGLALFPSDGRDGLTLLRQGEVAMRAAKQRHIPYVFANEMGDGPPPDQVSLIGEMREALERKEFVLYYQPKIDLAENRVSGAEALLRWQHPRRGLVPPGLFIPFAEQTGFIREITPWLVQMAVVQCAAWHRQGMSLVVSVNLSALDILNARIITLVQTLLAEHQLPAHLLCLEITESALINEPEVALKNLYALADLGVKLSIDDYGSGQASLGYLKSLPVHELKMDQSFVTGISTTPKNAAIVRSTIVLSHELGLAVTAEGVESTEDMEWLQAHACDLAQGYAIARPMPADLLPGWVARYQGQTEAA